MSHPAPSAQRFETMLTRHLGMDYLLYRPKENRPMPLVLFLHGSGERGNDVRLLEAHGLPKLLATTNPFPEPALVLAPQCATDSWWTLELDALETLLDDAVRRYPVDASRIYLTGLSMGGHGAWHLALKQPSRFAALAPICGGGLTPIAHRLASLPIWAFHGADDPVVPLRESTDMVEAVNRAGGHARLTVYEGVGHNSWTPAYSEAELYTWMFSQKRSSPGAPRPRNSAAR